MDIKQKASDYAEAWCSGDPARVAAHFTRDGEISINRGDALRGTNALTEMAAGFYAEFPDLVVKCDDIRQSGNHAIFVWTLEGHHAETKNLVRAGGWEEWELDEGFQIVSSKGWFDAENYQNQIDGV